MSSGQKAYWDSIEEQLCAEKFDKFTALTDDMKFKIISSLQDNLMRFISNNPSMTKYQWALMTNIENDIKKLL